VASARRQLFAEIDGLGAKIAPLQRPPAAVTPRLFDCNLISGVADARSLAM
jgi:hypothetical protein